MLNPKLSNKYGCLNINKIILDALSTGVYYDKSTKRYKYKDSNQFASREATVNLQKKFLDAKEKEFIEMAKRIKNGEIAIYKDLSKTLKEIHLSSAIIERQGSDKLNNSDLGVIGNILKKQYYSGKDDVTGKSYGLKYLLKDATNLSEAQLRQRLRLYVETAKVTASTLKRKDAIENGATHARRFLNPAEHCPDCIYYASLKRQIISVLPLPKTNCQCRSNCQCSIEYY